jgi:tRNA-Thr(GGU) m(6)t(6)A37 methyltransferase TsaA
MTTYIRPGEIAAPLDPAALAGDAHLVFIGRARTPWKERADCPRNLRQARERQGDFLIEIDESWRAGLRDLQAGGAVIVLTWMHEARRDLLIQAPQHSATTASVFALRSPVRPNPIGLHVVRLLACDGEAGLLRVDALDCLDGTPVLDIKPFLAGVDVPPDGGAASGEEAPMDERALREGA